MKSRPFDFGTGCWNDDRPKLLGIVNVTPDSFSDGGKYSTTERAIAHGERLLEEGADALDVGGESTRPGAPIVSEEEELRRVVPVVRALAAKGAIVSIDTTKPAVAIAALQAGARILNDVSLGASPEELGKIAAEHQAGYLLMHARGTAASMQSLANYSDVVSEVCSEWSARAKRLEQVGVLPHRIALDPGLGFAKRALHTIELLRSVARLRSLGYALCVGPSRKSFIDAREAYPAWDFAPVSPEQRVGGTAAAVTYAVLLGAEILRVHDVAVLRQAARVAQALRDFQPRTTAEE